MAKNRPLDTWCLASEGRLLDSRGHTTILSTPNSESAAHWTAEDTPLNTRNRDCTLWWTTEGKLQTMGHQILRLHSPVDNWGQIADYGTPDTANTHPVDKWEPITNYGTPDTATSHPVDNWGQIANYGTPDTATTHPVDNWGQITDYGTPDTATTHPVDNWGQIADYGTPDTATTYPVDNWGQIADYWTYDPVTTQPSEQLRSSYIPRDNRCPDYTAWGKISDYGAHDTLTTQPAEQLRESYVPRGTRHRGYSGPVDSAEASCTSRWTRMCTSGYWILKTNQPLPPSLKTNPPLPPSQLSYLETNSPFIKPTAHSLSIRQHPYLFIPTNQPTSYSANQATSQRV